MKYEINLNCSVEGEEMRKKVVDAIKAALDEVREEGKLGKANLYTALIPEPNLEYRYPEGEEVALEGGDDPPSYSYECPACGYGTWPHTHHFVWLIRQ